jgi:RNA polymerase sigma-70 factor (ECF subfamily)
MALADRFCAAIGAQPSKDLEAALPAVLERCRASWPGIDADEDFVEHLARRRFQGVPLSEPFDPGAHVTDLYLAWASGRGDPRALQHLEASALRQVARAVERMKLPAGVQPEDIVQRVRERVLVARSGAGPAILDYEGTGTLVSWLRTAAAREVVTQARAGGARRDDEIARLDVPVAGHHPELALARARFRAQFGEAFAEAVAELTSEDKNLLRLYYLDRVTADRIGALFGVNKSTISRRLDRMRKALLDRTRELLRAQLTLGTAELDSLLKMMDSSLQISIPAALFSVGAERDE